MNILNCVRILFVINTLYLMLKGDWINVIVVFLALVVSYFPQIIKKLLKITPPQSFNIMGIIFIVGSQWAGTYLRAYDVCWWWDVLLHGVSGILIGLFAFIVIAYFDKKAILFNNKLYGLISLIVWFTASSSAVFWEMGEYYGDKYLGTNSQLGSLIDTMEDMIICVVIGGILALYIYYIFKKDKNTYLKREIENFIQMNKVESE